MPGPLLEFQVSGAELRRAAGWLEKLALGRVQPGAEYLSGVLLRADLAALQVSFSATDLQTWGVSFSDATVRTSGQAVVSAKLLLSIAKTCTRTETVTFLREHNTVRVTGVSAAWRLPVMPDACWPRFAMRGDLAAEVDTDALTRALARVAPALDKELITPFWGGVALDVSPDRLTVVATDGFRAAYAYVPARTYVESAEAWVPASALTRALTGADGSTTVALHTVGPDNRSEAGLILSGTGYRARTRVLTEYALWRRGLAIIEQATHSRVVLNVKDAELAISRIGFLGNERAPLRMDIGKEDVTFSIDEEDNSKGSGYSTCSAEVSDDHHEQVVFTSGWLQDLLKGVDAPFAELVFSASHAGPVVAFPQNDDGERLDDYVYMVRPVNLARRKRR